MPSNYYLRARAASLARHRPVDDPERIAAAQQLRASVLADHIKRVVDSAPPLTPEQRDRLAALLRPAPSATRDPAVRGGDDAAA